jgi:hypothetical protein
MRRDLWRLATPLLAVGVSFIVVLIIGASSTGGSPKPKPTPTPTAQHGVDLTIMAVAQPVLPRGSIVTVRNATTLRPVVTNQPLNTHNSYTKHVPVQSYLVCLRPPKGWGSPSGDILSLGNWICMAEQIGPGPTQVTFRLVPRSAAASGAGQ